ncbi:MAG: TolC family outer membrane protein [Arcobacteraceae bacterium]|nr:TolC family outer membrane protein [Arcobacteraceae bacterium]
MKYKKNTKFTSALILAGLSLLNCNLDALTLKESIVEVLGTNPVVQERLKNFYETQQDLKIARSEYLPSLDLTSSYGRNKAGAIRSVVDDVSYQHYTNSLKITQNIFNGFSTTHKINYQEARILAAAYHYLENANDISFQMVNAYLDLIRSHKLVQNAKENVIINEEIYNDVQELYNSGLTTKSEVTKIYAALSLARSNFVVQQNNIKEKEFRFKRLFGRDIHISELEMPDLNLPMPESLQRATMYAMKNNPSIIVTNYNIQGAQALYKEKKSNFYPKINLEIEQLYNDAKESDNGYDTVDDRQKAYVVLNWNLYRGGADSASLQKTKSSIHKEVEVQRDLKRQTIEGIELSWVSYEMIAHQLKELYQYKTHSEETLESYQQEYEMGRRTLLDLLSAQNDLINARSQIINAEFDRLFAQYRILDAMGILVSALAGDTPAYEELLNPTQNPFDIIDDTLPINLDIDKDNIVDSLDICDNSKNNNDILPYGCSQKLPDSDFDGIIDSLDKCPNTIFGMEIDEYGCDKENGKNKFSTNPEAMVSFINPYNENSPIKSEKLGLYDYEYSTDFKNNIASKPLENHLMYDKFELIKRFEAINMSNGTQSQQHIIQSIVAEIKQHINKDILNITVIGYSNSKNDLEENFLLGMEYAKNIKNILTEQGIDENKITIESRANQDKLYLETNSNDKTLNSRVVVSLYVPKVEPIDSDKDGVIDIYDLCTNTQEGFIVDSSGCPLDDDNDGVVNNLDKCPDTMDGYQVDKDGCTVKLNLQVLFEDNSAIVRIDSLDRVDRFKQFLSDHPDYNTVIIGHTSKTKTSKADYNNVLSLKRAESIKNILVSGGIDESRITTIGKGFSEPNATNDTMDGQALNRRIEAEIIDTKVKDKSNTITTEETLNNSSWSID